MRAAGRGEARAATATDVQGSATGSTATRSNAPGRRRELGPLQDQALYNCQCGFVFEAPVSTSVGCPNCGNTQAW